MMICINKPLLNAFQEDHAILGHGFHDIATCLRANDLTGATAAATKLDREAGAHIGFEEIDFYPALAGFLPKVEIDRFYLEHQDGFGVLQTLMALEKGDELPHTVTEDLLQLIETFEGHVAECGNLFGTLGALSEGDQETLLTKLMAWRHAAPRWSELPSVTQLNHDIINMGR